MKAPRYIYMYRKGHNQPNKGEEITKADRKDASVLARIVDKVATKRLNAVRTAETHKTA